MGGRDARENGEVGGTKVMGWGERLQVAGYRLRGAGSGQQGAGSGDPTLSARSTRSLARPRSEQAAAMTRVGQPGAVPSHICRRRAEPFDLPSARSGQDVGHPAMNPSAERRSAKERLAEGRMVALPPCRNGGDKGGAPGDRAFPYLPTSGRCGAPGRSGAPGDESVSGKAAKKRLEEARMVALPRCRNGCDKGGAPGFFTFSIVNCFCRCFCTRHGPCTSGSLFHSTTAPPSGLDM